MILNLIELHKKYNMNITGVVHVGAHFGEEHPTYKSLGIDHITYFEPVKKTFAELKKRIGNDAVCYNCALGSANGTIEMNVETLDRYGCSSILQPSSNYAPTIFGGKETVDINRLDDYNFLNVNFLNIDVQGYELEVLKGGKELLKSVDYIILEVNQNIAAKPLDYIGASLIEDVDGFLGEYGFDLMEINWAGISWGDALYVKNKSK